MNACVYVKWTSLAAMFECRAPPVCSPSDTDVTVVFSFCQSSLDQGRAQGGQRPCWHPTLKSNDLRPCFALSAAKAAKPGFQPQSIKGWTGAGLFGATKSGPSISEERLSACPPIRLGAARLHGATAAATVGDLASANTGARFPHGTAELGLGS